MNESVNLVFSPQLIAWITAILLIFTYKSIAWQRALSAISVCLGLANAIRLLYIVKTEGIQVYWASNWQPPFGITMVLDMFSVIMVLLTAIISVVVVFYSFTSIDKDREKHFYYFFIQMLLVGCYGAFITGDLFNLYVWFEVLLIASYILLVHGSTKGQLRETYKYIILNVLASTFFLVGLGILYSVAGTLNMADLAVKLSLVENQGIVILIASIFIVVFGSKSAIFPLYFWLPQSYTQPPSAISVLFSGLLTKVGVYCLIRTFTLIFFGESPYINIILVVLGVATMVLGGMAAIAQNNFKRILSYDIISQVGFMLVGLAINTVASLAAAIFFVAHAIIVKSALFLFAGVTESITGNNDIKKMGGLLHRYPLLGWGFFFAALSIAGVPPLSGFFAKFLLLESAVQASDYWLIIFIVAVSFLTLFAMIRIFLNCYWGREKPLQSVVPSKSRYLAMLVPGLALVIISLLMGVFADFTVDLVSLAAEQLSDPSAYITAVLGDQAG